LHAAYSLTASRRWISTQREQRAHSTRSNSRGISDNRICWMGSHAYRKHGKHVDPKNGFPVFTVKSSTLMIIWHQCDTARHAKYIYQIRVFAIYRLFDTP
jgi:hypothetical protein